MTLSYAGWEASDGSLLSPSPLLLHVLRARERDPDLTFEGAAGAPGLEAALGEPRSPVPVEGLALDANDVWLGAISAGPRLLEASDLVAASFPMLAAGLSGETARAGSVVGPHHGLVDGGGALDPRLQADGAISASALEKLAGCPLAWFYRYGLRIRKPEDPEYEPGRWLDPGQRGRLLHAVFQRFGEAYRARQDELDGEEARDLLLSIVEQELRRLLDEVPAPSSAALAAESDEIRSSALAFLEMERRSRDATWEAFELEFGQNGLPPATIAIAGGALRVRGKIDRVDRFADGSLRVIDYKTGQAKYYERAASGPAFAGGRRIQAGVYTAVAEVLYGGPVRSFEYRFPTLRGEHGRVPYDRSELHETGRVVADLLEMIRRGWFVATDDAEDCRLCDYRPVCRVTGGKREPVRSPRAEWARAQGERLEQYAILRRLRERA